MRPQRYNRAAGVRQFTLQGAPHGLNGALVAAIHERFAMKYFGTDGFRGEANQGLTVDHAFKIGRYVGWYYGARQGRKARVVVGKDTRRSSYMFESALVAGLVASGADAYMLHVIPTPGVAYETVDGRFDCGIMISASHNPYTDNGIKLVNGEGYKMDEDVWSSSRTTSTASVTCRWPRATPSVPPSTTCRAATATSRSSSPALTSRCRA